MVDSLLVAWLRLSVLRPLPMGVGERYAGSVAPPGRQASRTPTHPLALDVGVRDGLQHDVVLPAGIGPTFEVVDAKFFREFLEVLSRATSPVSARLRSPS